MLPHEIDEAADRAFSEHVASLVQTLLRNHNPFNKAEENDNALRHFSVGLKHTLGVRKLVEDTIARVITEQE